MDFLNTFLIGTIVGLLLNLFLSRFFEKRGKTTWATKEDVSKITEDIKTIKYAPEVIPVENDYNLEEAEQEFYNSIADTEKTSTPKNVAMHS